MGTMPPKASVDTTVILKCCASVRVMALIVAAVGFILVRDVPSPMTSEVSRHQRDRSPALRGIRLVAAIPLAGG